MPFWRPRSRLSTRSPICANGSAPTSRMWLAASVSMAASAASFCMPGRVLGLTFKPNTDDMRDAPSLDILPRLAAAGAVLRAFDPEGMAEAKKLLPDLVYCPDAYEAMEGADALVLLTEWNEFRALDLARVRRLLSRPLVIDLRNIYRPAEMADAGLSYVSIGRPP